MSKVTIEKDKIKDISGENLFKCWYCGRCSASCPFTEFMDTPPHRLIRRILKDGTVDESEIGTIWTCAACFECTDVCPVEFDFSKIAEGFRELILRRGDDYHSIDEIDKEELKKMPQILLVSEFRKHTR